MHFTDGPTFLKQSDKLVECGSAARVQPRTSQGVTDLLLPHSSLRWTHKVTLQT